MLPEDEDAGAVRGVAAGDGPAEPDSGSGDDAVVDGEEDGSAGGVGSVRGAAAGAVCAGEELGDRTVRSIAGGRRRVSGWPTRIVYGAAIPFQRATARQSSP